MQKDTRDRNETFPTETIGAYLTGYMEKLKEALHSVDRWALDLAYQKMNYARTHGFRIFVAGNGGSAAIAQHLVCDFSKGTHVDHARALDIVCLSENVPVITAIANDISYDDIFSYQLRLHNPTPGEILMLVSSSGNSKNIVKAATFAKMAGMCVIGLTGFLGGDLKELADIELHVEANNYGIVEDAHQALMHILAQFYYLAIVKSHKQL